MTALKLAPLPKNSRSPLLTALGFIRIPDVSLTREYMLPSYPFLSVRIHHYIPRPEPELQGNLVLFAPKDWVTQYLSQDAGMLSLTLIPVSRCQQSAVDAALGVLATRTRGEGVCVCTPSQTSNAAIGVYA